MALRLNSLKTRTALAISMVIVVIQMANAVYLILAKRRELRRDIENRAVTFALLTRQPLCAGYELYFDSGAFKFWELVRKYMRIDPDVESLRVVNVSGQVLFDSAELDEPGADRTPGPRERWITDTVRLEAVKRLEHTVIPGRDAAGREGLEIIAPYLDDVGRHKLSVSYRVSYRHLGPGITPVIYATAGLTLISIVVSLLVAVALASRITRPVEELTAGAKDLAEGHFDRRLSIRSGDELQMLAEAFNHMTERLKHNVEQLEESNKKLAAANDELKELDLLKSDLLANVSHELRTPLTAIKGYTDYILERKLGSVTEKQEKGLVVVQRNLERLSKSINALLDFSRMDVGRISVSLQPFNLAGLIEQVVLALRSELEKKSLAFATQISSGLQPVIGDREKLSQVLENLVMNAIKFTPPGGGITVAASRSPSTSRPAAEIRVSDTGVGIPSDQISKIFHRFHQVDGTTTRRYGGVGLGLAIVKSILDAHGSAIRVESEAGQGTTFHFTLPLLDKGESPFREERGRGRTEDGLVLVATDSPEPVRILRPHLEQEGLAVLVSPLAESAALAAQRRPEAILVDLGDCGPASLELVRRVRHDSAIRDIPVLAVLAAGGRVKAFAPGPLEHVGKPVDPPSLGSAASRLVSPSQRPNTALIASDEPVSAAMARDCLGALGFGTTIARDTSEALESLGRRRPDLVVVDLARAGSQRFDVLEAAARSEAGAIPAVVMAERAGAPADTMAGTGAPADTMAGAGARGSRSPAPSGADSEAPAPDVRAFIAEVRRHIRARERREDVGRAIL